MSGFGHNGNGSGWKNSNTNKQQPRGGQGPQDFDIKSLLPNGLGGKSFIFVALAILGLYGSTGFYRVNPGQEGIELVFGSLSETTSPGLHYNYPFPIGKTLVPDVQKVRRVDIGYRPDRRLFGDSTDANNITDVPAESLILTKDENIVDTDFTVFWKIKDTANFLFNIRDPQQTVKIAAESAMREIVGQTKFDNAVTIGREEIERRTKTLLQITLDSYKAGIDVEQVELQKSDPPAEVIDAFNDVQRARQDRDRLRNEAESYANTVVPEARGKAEGMIRQAEGFKEKSIKESEGEAARFLKVYAEYRRSPVVVKKRIYLDTMAELYSKLDKVLVDNKTGGVLPYLKLPNLDKKGK